MKTEDITQAQIHFVASHLNTWSRRELAKKAGLSYDNLYYVLGLLGVKIRSNGCNHPKEVDDYIIEHFPNTKVEEISEAVGLSESQVLKIAKRLGVKRSEEFMNRKSLVGQKIGRLSVLRKLGILPGKRGTCYECLCECGNTVVVEHCKLQTCNTKSCGCLVHRKKHGGFGTKLYGVYHHMKERCNNAYSKNAKNYHDRGISICQEWLDDFGAFQEWALNNGYQEGLSIDRIDNNGNYCQENCRWTTAKVQCNNTRRNRLITYNGKTQTISQWADELGEPYDVLIWKVNKGTFPPNHNYVPKRGRLYEFRGKKLTIKQWAEEFGLNYHTVKHWVHDGKFPPKEGEPFNY